MSRRNKHNAMQAAMGENFDRLSDGSLNIDSDDGYNKLARDDRVNGIPAINDNDFLDKLEKKYRHGSDEEIRSHSGTDSDQSRENRNKNSRKYNEKKDRENARAWKLLGGGKMAPRFGETLSELGDEREKDAVFEHTLNKGGLFENIKSSPLKNHLPKNFDMGAEAWLNRNESPDRP